jgi:RNA polymerase sigma-70 factor (ECF subfamily)
MEEGAMDKPAVAAGRATAEADSEVSDSELMRAVARQDRQAFKVLYERHVRRIGGYLLKLLKRPEWVDEAMNDVMLAVWQSADRFDPGQGPLSAWLLGIAHHKGLHVLRRATRLRAEVSFDSLSPTALDEADDRENAPHAVAPHTPEQAVMGWELGQALAWALDRLSPEHRAVIELTFGEERSYLEIADIMDCPVNTVKTRMFHARKKLVYWLAQRGHPLCATTEESSP